MTEKCCSELAEQLAIDALKNVRRRNGDPYFNHCRRVADQVARFGQEFEAAALLHDILEETVLVPDNLYESGISPNVIKCVKALTHNKDRETYKDYLKRVAKNNVATVVKIADMFDNISDAPTNDQIEKYRKGIYFLLRENQRGGV